MGNLLWAIRPLRQERVASHAAWHVRARGEEGADPRGYSLFYLPTSPVLDVTAPHDSNEATAPACFTLTDGQCSRSALVTQCGAFCQPDAVNMSEV
jgi:hypothetical protein